MRRLGLGLAVTCALLSCKHGSNAASLQSKTINQQYGYAAGTFVGLTAYLHESVLKACLRNTTPESIQGTSLNKALLAWVDAMRPYTTVQLPKQIQLTTDDCTGAHVILQYNPGVSRPYAQVQPGYTPVINIGNDNPGFPFYNSLVHEVGHTMGLGDTYVEGVWTCQYGQPLSLMCSTRYDRPQTDDVSGVMALYREHFGDDSATKTGQNDAGVTVHAKPSQYGATPAKPQNGAKPATGSGTLLGTIKPDGKSISYVSVTAQLVKGFRIPFTADCKDPLSTAYVASGGRWVKADWTNSATADTDGYWDFSVNGGTGWQSVAIGAAISGMACTYNVYQAPDGGVVQQAQTQTTASNGGACYCAQQLVNGVRQCGVAKDGQWARQVFFNSPYYACDTNFCRTYFPNTINSAQYCPSGYSDTSASLALDDGSTPAVTDPDNLPTSVKGQRDLQQIWANDPEACRCGLEEPPKDEEEAKVRPKDANGDVILRCGLFGQDATPIVTTKEGVDTPRNCTYQFCQMKWTSIVAAGCGGKDFAGPKDGAL